MSARLSLLRRAPGGPARGRGLARRPIRFAQAATDAIAVNGTPDLAAHGEAHTTRFDALAPENDRGRPVNVFAPLEERPEVGAGGQPFASREASRQTVSRLRPLARRRFNTFRPPLVFIRSRKPCVFFRRRTFG